MPRIHPSSVGASLRAPPGPHFPMKYKFKTKPYAHQKLALKRFIRMGHYGALWEPRTGKSKFVVDSSAALFQMGRVERVLIVCPLSVIGVWEDEYETHCPVPFTIRALTKGDNDLKWPKRRALSVLVVNYDLAWRRDKIIRNFRPDMAVVDESHRVKKPSARRSRFVRSLNKTRYRTILTGTPTPKSYLDIYGQWAFLNPRRFGTRIDDFKDRYIRFGGYMGYQIKGYRHFAELKDKIETDAQVVLRKDVMDVPDELHQRVPVQLEESAWQTYYDMAYQLFIELQNGETSDAKNVAVKMLRLQQITGGWIKSDEGNVHQVSRAKIAAFEDLALDTWEADEPLVVFARYKPELDALTDVGTRHRIKTYVIRGGIGQQERDAARRKFQASKGRALFVGQIQASGLGIPLHRAHETVFYSVTLAYDDYKQALDRTQGSGQQSETVRYRTLVASHTVDLDIYANLQRKQDTQSLLMTPSGRRGMIRSLARNLQIDLDE